MTRDVEICSETFGERGGPAILLIMGAMASMLWWPDEFCERLAGAGRFVIRYDNRDTGRSTGYEPGIAAYTSEDMAGDAIAVLDQHGVGRAHVVGMSMGGGIAQLLALAHPERVASVTAISTAVGEENPDLPGPTAKYMEHAAAFDDLDWSDTQALADLIVEDARQLAGTQHAFDEAAARELVTRDLERAIDPSRLANHGNVGGDEPSSGRVGEIAVPFLVIHGTAEPALPAPARSSARGGGAGRDARDDRGRGPRAARERLGPDPGGDHRPHRCAAVGVRTPRKCARGVRMPLMRYVHPSTAPCPACRSSKRWARR